MAELSLKKTLAYEDQASRYGCTIYDIQKFDRANMQDFWFVFVFDIITYVMFGLFGMVLGMGMVLQL